MKSIIFFLIRIISVVSFAVIFASCAVITRSTEGTTETMQNTTDASTEAAGASTEFTSSTSPRAEASAQSQKVRAFAENNLERLREDMARGGGEYLAAFAYLLNIPETRQNEFFTFTRRKFSILFISNPTTAEDMLTRLDAELGSYLYLTQ